MLLQERDLMAQALDDDVVFSDFREAVSADAYAPVPDDAWIGLTDVVGSTAAIVDGRAKAVNMAGAAAISAAMNALGRRSLQFAFGGDGAVIAVQATEVDRARTALAQTAGWCRDELDLELRAALVPVREIRSQGLDVRVASYAPSAAVRYAMFSGGGIRWAEARMKDGAFRITPAPKGNRPDLTGLSCRWQPVRPERGVVLSLIVQPVSSGSGSTFDEIVCRVLDRFDTADRGGHPIPRAGPAFGSPFAGFDLERRTATSKASRIGGTVSLLAWRVFAWAVVASRLRVAGFQADHYRRATTENSDYRKFQDGLHMTVSCDSSVADDVEALLTQAEAAGVLQFGTCRQDRALMTCIVPDYAADDHFHFIDGAAGGYAAAALMLKARAR